jgi:hypothetical protein
MALSISITLTIIMLYILYFLKKKLTFLHNSIVFIIIALITKNHITIMTIELKMLKTTEDNFLFLFLLMYREVFVPLIVLIFTNSYLISSSWKKKMLLFIGTLVCMHGMDRLTIYFNVIKYVNWNFILAVFVDIAYLLIGLGLAKFVIFLKEWENRNHESRV